MQGVPHRLEQRNQLLQTIGQGSLRDGCAQSRQIHAQPVGRCGIQIFSQPHLDPYRNPQATLRQQARGRWRRNHARHTRTAAGLAIALALDPADIGLHLDFDDLGIFRPRKRGQGQPAAGTDLLFGRQAPIFLDHRQVGTRGAAMSRTPALMTARARWFGFTRLHLRSRGALLAPFAIKPLFEIADARVQQVHFLFESRLARHGPVVLAFPVAGLPFQLDVVLLGQGDHDLRERCPLLPRGKGGKREKSG